MDLAFCTRRSHAETGKVAPPFYIENHLCSSSTSTLMVFTYILTAIRWNRIWDPCCCIIPPQLSTNTQTNILTDMCTDVSTFPQLCPHRAAVEFNCSHTSSEPLVMLWNLSFALECIRNQQTAHYTDISTAYHRTRNLSSQVLLWLRHALWSIIRRVIDFIVAALSFFRSWLFMRRSVQRR